MRHLAPEILVALAECAEAPIDAHLRDCDRCRRAVDDLRAMLAAARQDVVPEPSPLFWDRFSARVTGAVAAEEDGKVRARFGAPRASWLLRGVCFAAAGLLLVVVALGGARVFRPQTPAPALTAASERTSGSEAPAPEEIADGAWSLVVELAEDLDWDAAAAAGMGPVPGSAEEVVVQLSAAEQGELARLVRSELEGRPM